MSTHRPTVPPPLVVAASLVAVEGLVLVGYAVLELVSTSGDRVALGVTTALFFAAYGVLLLAAAWAVSHGRSWARSPIVLAQLIQLGVAWGFRGGDTTVVAVVLALVSAVVLVGLLAPVSVAALAEHDQDRGPDAS